MTSRTSPGAQPPLSLEVLSQAAECLRTIAHPHRLRMIQLMLQGEHTVGELAESCDVASHAASEHLILMRRCGLLKSEQRGRRVFYQVAEAHLADIVRCIEHRFGNGAAIGGDQAADAGRRGRQKEATT
jgi:DNA-binding transcriptional ArsR family regulator